MADYESDQDLQAFKNWWKENGRAVILGAVIGLGSIGGWRGYSWYHERHLEAASDLYVSASAALENEDWQALPLIAAEVRADYAGTPYAALVQLALARAQVELGDLEAAQTALEWASEHAVEAEVQYIARLRLARVHLEQEAVEQAQKLLDEPFPAGFAALVAELRGDAFLAQGETRQAREAYEQALRDLTDSQARTKLEMKLADLQ